MRLIVHFIDFALLLLASNSVMLYNSRSGYVVLISHSNVSSNCRSWRQALTEIIEQEPELAECQQWSREVLSTFARGNVMFVPSVSFAVNKTLAYFELSYLLWFVMCSNMTVHSRTYPYCVSMKAGTTWVSLCRGQPWCQSNRWKSLSMDGTEMEHDSDKVLYYCFNNFNSLFTSEIIPSVNEISLYFLIIKMCINFMEYFYSYLYNIFIIVAI
jgi:hypothetical protein